MEKTVWMEQDQASPSGKILLSLPCPQVTRVLDKLAVSIVSCVTHIPRHCSQTTDRTTMANLLRLMSKAIRKLSISRKKAKSSIHTRWIWARLTKRSLRERKASELNLRKQISLSHLSPFSKPAHIMRPTPTGTMAKTMSSMKSTHSSLTIHCPLLEHPLTNKISLRDKQKNFVACKKCWTIMRIQTTSN